MLNWEIFFQLYSRIDPKTLGHFFNMPFILKFRVTVFVKPGIESSEKSHTSRLQSSVRSKNPSSLQKFEVAGWSVSFSVDQGCNTQISCNFVEYFDIVFVLYVLWTATMLPTMSSSNALSSFYGLMQAVMPISISTNLEWQLLRFEWYPTAEYKSPCLV